MKTTKLLNLAILFTISAQAAVTTSSLKNISEFMMAPRTAQIPWADVPASPIITEEMAPNGTLGFRVIHLKKSNQAKKEAAVELASTNALKSGDVLLSFRPEWDGTLAYAHMQLGVSHASLAFVVKEGGSTFIHTLESPLNYSSPMNSSHHYGDLNAIHVIRPDLTPTQQANLAGWAKLILKDTSKFGFFSDYGKPYYARGLGASTPLGQIVKLRQVIKTGGKFDSYCSEFVWTVLGLRNCNPAEAFNPESKCEKVIYGTNVLNKEGALTGLISKLGANQAGAATNAGLIQGPEAALVSAKVDAAIRNKELQEKAFFDILSNPDELAGRMSSGHRAVAEANSGLMKMISAKYYGGTEDAALAAQINTQVVDNFSPTSFMIRSNAGLDGFKYVGTVVFDR